MIMCTLIVRMKNVCLWRRFYSVSKFCRQSCYLAKPLGPRALSRCTYRLPVWASRQHIDRRYSTMADTTEASGLTRRGVEAMLKRIGHVPQFVPPNMMRLELSNLSLGIFDAQGHRQLACYFMKLLDISTLYWPLPVMDPDEKYFIYTLNYEMNLHPSLYDDSKKYPLVVENKVNYVKRTSRCNQIDIRQVDQSVPMVSVCYLDINVDEHTRRPKPFPQWWKDENRFPEDGRKPEVEDITNPTASVLKTERRVHFTDTDENNHTNFTIYVKMCLDTFYENVHFGRYNNSSPVFLKGWLKNMKVAFKKESKLGDILNIESWEDSGRPNTFHFVMKKGDEVITTVSFTFYASLTGSNL